VLVAAQPTLSLWLCSTELDQGIVVPCFDLLGGYLLSDRDLLSCRRGLLLALLKLLAFDPDRLQSGSLTTIPDRLLATRAILG